MKPLRLCLKNFMGHSLSDLDFTQSNVYLIVGKGKDGNDRKSNGVGKTTIFHAIKYALTGDSPTKTLEGMVREGKDRLEVIFEFLLNNIIYRVTRSYSKKSGSDLIFEIKNEDIWTSIGARTIPEIQNEIVKKTKINKKTFDTVLLFAHSDLNGLPTAANANQRQEILKDPLQLIVYDRLEKLAKDKCKKIHEEIKNIDLDIAKSNNFESLDEDKLNYKNIIDQINKNSIKYDNIELKIKKSEQELKDLEISNPEYLKFSSKLDNLQSQQKILQRILQKDQSDLLILISNSKRIEDEKINLSKSKIENEILINSIKNNIKDLNKLQVQDELSKLHQNEMQGFSYVNSVNKKLQDCSKPLDENSSCSHCKQIISIEYRNEYSEKNKKEAIRLTELLKTAQEKLNKIQSKKQLLNKSLNAAILAEQQLSVSSTKLDNINHLLNKNFSTHSENAQLINSSSISIENQKKSISDLSKEISQLNKQIQDLQIDVLKENIAKKVKEITELKVELNQISQILAADKRSLDWIQKKIDQEMSLLTKTQKLKQDRGLLEEKLFIAQQGIIGFADVIPKIIIEKVLSSLSVEGNKILDQLYSGFQFQFQNGLENDIKYFINGIPKEYNGQLSTGQKFRLAVTFKRGLSLVIQKELNIEVQFLAFDEVDSNLDEEGIDAFLDLLKQWNDLTLFVITHNKALKDKFTHAILVEETDDGSVARIVTDW